MMNIGHVSVLMLGAGMHMFVGMSFLFVAVRVKIVIVTMNMLMYNRHVEMEMGVFFICQYQRTCNHKYGSHDKQECDWVLEDKHGQKHACLRCGPV